MSNTEEKLIPIIDVPYGEIAPRVLVCGDPKRAEKIAERLDNVKVVSKSREYWTYTGEYKGVPVSVQSHGVGGNGASISFEGLILGGAKVIIRVGTCGVLQKDLPAGTLIIATGACRDDGITDQMIPQSYPAIASTDVVLELGKAAGETEASHKVGLVTTGGIFYKGLLPTNLEIFSKANVLAYENEASVLFVICGIHNVKCGMIATADGPAFEFVGSDGFDHYPEGMDQAKSDSINIALEAVINVEV